MTAFDAATLAELERLKTQGAAHAKPNAAGDAAAELARAIATTAPPVGVSAEQVHKIGEDAVAAVRQKLDRAEQGYGHEQITSSADGPRGPEGRQGGSEDGAEAATADEGGAQDDPQSREGEDAPVKRGKHAPTKALGHGQNPNRMVAKDSSVARFASCEADPENVWILPEDHAAAVEGRTLFPGMVVDTFKSPRFLVSGHNNPKLGKVFQKGPWNGYPLFQLSLEERATCPRSCLQWRSCMGNNMHLARRNDHRDPDFLPALKAEVVTMARAHPQGFVVRLHTLGDFYSVEYVQLWAELLDALPNLRIFGYTARREDADDEESRRIAKAIRWLTEQAWDLFAIRFSGHDGPQGSIVVREPDARDHVIMCPAQTYATHACVTCGLCSSPEAKDKAIGFLLHGRKAFAPKPTLAPEDQDEVERAARARYADETHDARNARWRRDYETGMSLSEVAENDGRGFSPGAVQRAVVAAGGVLRGKTEAKKLKLERAEDVKRARANPPPLSRSAEADGARDTSPVARAVDPKLEQSRAVDVIAETRSKISLAGKR